MLQATQFSAHQVGITEPSEESLNIYPNPTSDYIHIDGLKTFLGIRLYTLWGQLVYDSDQFIQKIDVRDYAPGWYILKAELEKRHIIQKIRIR
ncbi:MAG: T9SS type A sorting domain-containing protein [Bacteroidota bacterium]